MASDLEQPDENDPANAFPVLTTLQLRGLYGAVIRNIVSVQNFADYNPHNDSVMWNVASKMREEITRRAGDTWLTKWHSA